MFLAHLYILATKQPWFVEVIWETSLGARGALATRLVIGFRIILITVNLKSVLQPTQKVTRIAWFRLCENSRIGKSTQTESRLEVVRPGGSREWGVTARRHAVSFWGEENVLERDRADGCTALWTTKCRWFVHSEMAKECEVYPN